MPSPSVAVMESDAPTSKEADDSSNHWCEMTTEVENVYKLKKILFLTWPLHIQLPKMKSV